MTVIRECVNPECTFRYPDHDSNHPIAYCPKCGQRAEICGIFPESNQLSFLEKKNPSFHLSILLDNVRSIYNAGSIFRTAEGFGIEELFLCGITPTPQHARFSKTSLGAEQHLKWSYHPNAVTLCNQLKKSETVIISLENSAQATNLYAFQENIFNKNALLVVGNEISGVDPQLLQMSSYIFAIPMAGFKHSFNVATAFGIAVSYFYSLSLS